MESRAIYKYELPLYSEFTTFNVPQGFHILSAQVQNGLICIWAEVDTTVDGVETVRFRLVGTGWLVDLEGWTYIDTVQLGEFVWHIYYSVT